MTMIATQVAQIVADIVLFLKLADEETLDPDQPAEMMALLGQRLEEMDKAFLRELVDAFPVVAADYSGAAQEVVLDIPFSFYLEEMLAADDPARLAELAAIRDARA